MRPVALAAICLAFSAPALAAESLPPGPIDLNRPGVLEQLKRDHPQRYAAIRDVLKVSARFPCVSEELRLLKARYELQQLECAAQLLTSWPAKRNLSFVLENTAYVARVVVPPTESTRPALTRR